MSTYLTAIEIGSSKIKGAVGIINDDGTFSVIAIEQCPLKAGSVRYGCVSNVEEVGNSILHVKRLLENNPNVSPRKIKGAYIAMGGRSLSSHLAESTKTFNTDTEITEEVMGELKAKVRSEKATGKEILDIVPVHYNVDGKNNAVPVGTIGFQIRARYNLVVCDEKIKKNITRAFDKSGLKIMGGIARILAIDSLVLTKDKRNLGSVLIDFGAETTTVAVYKENALRYLATIPMGSRFITRDLANVLNISEERAEELKLNHINLARSLETEEGSKLDKTLDNLDYTLINNIAQARTSEIITNIAYQINQSGLRPEELTEGIVLVGKGSRLNGFGELIERNLNMKVSRPSRIEDINYSYNLNVPITEALDVIAILAAAARSGQGRDCTELPVVETVTTEADIQSQEQKVDVRKEEKKKKKEKKQGSDGGERGGIFSGILRILASDDDEFDSEEQDN